MLQKTSIEIFQGIKKNGVFILDNVDAFSPKEAFVSGAFVIFIVHRGRIQIMLDERDILFGRHAVGVFFPGHDIKLVSKSDDFLATLVMMDTSLLNDPFLGVINIMRSHYEANPKVELSSQAYTALMRMVLVMHETEKINLTNQRLTLTIQMEFLMRLLNYYQDDELEKITIENRVSKQFLSDLSKYYNTHREVGFYAEKACLSPKHFSSVIKKETGQSASKLIHAKIISEAKVLLHIRRDLSIQAIAGMLGFNDQSVFSRYFHRETGVYPTEYREQL